MSYLQPYTLGAIIRSAFGIYFRNAPTLFMIYVIPLVPTQVLAALLSRWGEGAQEARVVVLVLDFMASTLVFFPAAVAVSEICLGIRPSVARAYRRAFAHPGRVLGTYLLSLLMIMLGVVALVIPGIVFVLWYLFVASVVVIEGLGGRAALRRSRELGRGSYFRNLGVLLVAFFATVAAATLVMAVLAIIAAVLGVGDVKIYELLWSFSVLVAMPAYIVSIVLLYYDMRARKEGYGAAQLAEDLRF
jgi:hypothetical protein